MDTQIAIVQFLFKNNWKVLSDSLGANPALTAHKFDTAPDVLKFCATQQNCLIIVSVTTKDDLIQLATFIKASRKALKSTVMKVVVVNASENKQFEKAIAKLGSVEILEPTVNVKALRFKMDFWMKAMRAQSKKLGGDLNKKSLEANAQETASGEGKALNSVPPLETENDIWILSKESDCKKIIGRWMVKFMGPGPFVAQWNEVPNKPNMWSFQIKKSFIEQFIAGDGSWLFKGEQKPEFNWQENRWMMTGESFELLFYDGKTSFTRAKVENKVLTIAGNSVYAKTKESLINDSFNKELVFKNEADVLKDQSLDFENEGDLGGHLEGKVKESEKAGKGHLEGKLKEKEEAGKGPLEGKVNDREEAKGNLEGKVKEKEEPGKGPLEGKLKEREEEKSPYKGMLGTEEKAKEKAEKEKHAQSNEHLAGSWKGKLSEDEKKQAAEKEDYKQHNEKLSNKWDGQIKENGMEPSVPVARRKPESSENEGPESRNKGEAADRLKSHWGGKASASKAENSVDGSAPGPDEVKEGKLLGLKQDEKQHQTHYRKHNEAKQYEAGELGQNTYDSELGGKSSTDKLASHYGMNKRTGERSQDKKETDDLAGESHTDRLASHYGGGKKATSRNSESPDDLDGESHTDRLPSHMGRRNRDPSETEPQKQKSFMSGKVGTESIKSHYGTGKRPVKKSGGDLSDDIDDISFELEDAIDAPKGEVAENVLPFVQKAEEKDLEKLTESGIVSSFITQNESRYECRLDDFFDNDIIFVCSADGLKNSEKAAIDMSFAYQGELAQVNCEGIVMSIDQDGAGSFYVTIQIKPEDAVKMAVFTELMQSRQENIDTFLVKARGY